MVVENNIAISSKPTITAGSTVNNGNFIKTAPMPPDSVEISSKKGGQKTDWKRIAKNLAIITGIAFFGMLIGVGIQRKNMLPKPEKLTKEYEEVLKRSLTDAEKARIDEKCKNAKKNDTFFSDFWDALIMCI